MPAVGALQATEPADDVAPEVVAQFGQLVGAWDCTSERRQPDGTMAPGPGTARWTFFYTLGGTAIGDVFEPPADSGGPVGINLRVWNPERQVWVLAWTTAVLGRYDHFEAREEGEALIMRGEIPASGPFPDHAARITFSEISDASFEWKYEATSPGGAGPWQEFSRIHCRAAAT